VAGGGIALEAGSVTLEAGGSVALGAGRVALTTKVLFKTGAAFETEVTIGAAATSEVFTEVVGTPVTKTFNRS
jgi:hypothetical protein